MTRKEFEDIRKYLAKLTSSSKFENHVYIVGGAVRDYILYSPIKDIDLVVDMPDGGIEFAKWMEENGYTHGSVVTYPTYGTAMFKPSKFQDIELECVQTRGEQYHDKNSRNPKTCFANIEEDAFRRDLTINALYMTLDGKILDITKKGLDDIKNHIIRVTNDTPDVVFEDDPLRMLRVLRFTCRLGWEIEEDTYSAIKRNVNRLQIISKERIQDEFRKILISKNPRLGMELLRDTGLLLQFIPEFEETFDMVQNVYHDFCTVWEHTLKVVANASGMNVNDNFQKEVLMLGAVFHDIGKIKVRTVKDGNVHFIKHELASRQMTETILRRLKYSNDIIDEVCFIVENHMRFKGFGDKVPSDKSIRKFQYTSKNQDRFRLAVLLMHADNLSHGKDYCLPKQSVLLMERSRQLIAYGEDMFGYKLPINGFDIMKIKNIEGGPKVKECQDYLIKLAFNGVNKMNRNECIKRLKGYRL